MKKNGKSLRFITKNSELFFLLIKFVKSIIVAVITPKKHRISGSFSEKIMLAVTGVNECKFCSYLHTQTALEKGVSEDEIKNLLLGEFDNFSSHESVGILYGEHWAETKGKVSEDAKKRLMEFYGEKKAAHIESFIVTVYMGNMCSNTVVAYKENLLPLKDKIRLFLSYIIAVPIAFGINNSGKLLAWKRGKKSST